MSKRLFKKFQILFENYKNKKNDFTDQPGDIILVDFNGWSGTHIAQLLIANIFSQIAKKKIIGFSHNFFFQNNTLKLKIIFYLKWFLGSLFNLRNFGIYKNLGTKKIFFMNPTNYQIYRAKQFKNFFYKKKITKEKILKLRISNILIGDIIYDSFMHQYKKETIEVYDPLFIRYFEKFVATYFFWVDYLKENKVNTVISSHPTYLDGLPSRIGIHLNIRCFIVGYNRVYSLNKKIIYPQREHISFKKTFSKLTPQSKKLALIKAKSKIKKRFQGKLGDMIYLTKTAFGSIKKKKVLVPSNKKKILIAAHSLSDAPHARGQGIFVDFYEWLKFLFKLSKNTNYDWYIKCHPNFHEYDDKTIEIIKDLVKKNKNVKWVPPLTSHNQLIKEGINLALTVDGSIGLEYPYFNIPVFNASRFNSHMNYKFNEHPQTIKEYKNLILNFKKHKSKIKKNEIFECYFMSNDFYNDNWLINDYDKLTSYIDGNYRDINISKKMYSYFEASLNQNNFNYIVDNFINFYLKNEYVFNPIYNDKY